MEQVAVERLQMFYHSNKYIHFEKKIKLSSQPVNFSLFLPKENKILSIVNKENLESVDLSTNQKTVLFVKNGDFKQIYQHEEHTFLIGTELLVFKDFEEYFEFHMNFQPMALAFSDNLIYIGSSFIYQDRFLYSLYEIQWNDLINKNPKPEICLRGTSQQDGLCINLVQNIGSKYLGIGVQQGIFQIMDKSTKKIVKAFNQKISTFNCSYFDEKMNILYLGDDHGHITVINIQIFEIIKIISFPSQVSCILEIPEDRLAISLISGSVLIIEKNGWKCIEILKENSKILHLALCENMLIFSCSNGNLSFWKMNIKEINMGIMLKNHKISDIQFIFKLRS
jgi:hypothetical protein